MKFDLKKVIQKIQKPWQPVDVAVFGDSVLRVALFQGVYHWHEHDYDELFLVYRGSITIYTEKDTIIVEEGGGTVIPAHTKHKPASDRPAYVVMLDKK